MIKLFAVGLGGALGAVIRYEFDQLLHNANHSFPWGTLLANLLGCFLIGFFFKLFEDKIAHEHLRVMVMTGFLGALTTFSSYSYATLIYLENGQIGLGLSNLFLNNLLGVLLAATGSLLSVKLFPRKRRL